MLQSIIVFLSLLVASALGAYLIWIFTRRLITVGDLKDAEWNFVGMESKLNGFLVMLTSGNLTLLYAVKIDSERGEVLTRIEVQMKGAQGEVRADVKDDEILVAYASNINYPPLARQWAYDLKNEIENIIDEHFKNQPKDERQGGTAS